MSENNVLSEQLEMRLPPNWERAHDYTGNAPFVAIWWADSGETVHIDDGSCRLAVTSTPFSEDLIRMAVKAHAASPGGCHSRASPGGCHSAGIGLYATLGYGGDTASHCLPADLEDRSVYRAPLDDALAWLAQILPPRDDEPASSKRQMATEGRSVCIDYGGFGWVRASEHPEGVTPAAPPAAAPDGSRTQWEICSAHEPLPQSSD